MEKDLDKEAGSLKYTTVIVVGIILRIIGSVFGGIAGGAMAVAGDLFGWVSVIMLIIQFFSKSTDRKEKNKGCALVLLWLIVIVVTGAMLIN